MFLVYSQTCWQWTLWRPTELDIHCAVLDKDEPLVDGFQVSKYFSFGYSLRKLGLRETRGGSIERQLEQLQHCDELFIDKVSGKDVERPKLQEMMRHIRRGDIIEVTSIDRLARNNIDLQNLVKEITAKGVVIKFLKEGLTFGGDGNDNAISKMMLTMLAAISEFERALIRERQREGIALAKAKDKYKGRSPKLNSEQVEQLKQRIEAGESKASVAKAFEITRMTVYSYLKSN